MIKKLLLKIAHKIHKYYNIVEINKKDLIKYKDDYYGIVKIQLTQEAHCIDVLEIELHKLYDEPYFKLKDNK